MYIFVYIQAQWTMFHVEPYYAKDIWLICLKNRNFSRIDPKSSQFSWKVLKFLILAKNTRPTRKLRFLGPENDSKMPKWALNTHAKGPIAFLEHLREMFSGSKNRNFDPIDLKLWGMTGTSLENRLRPTKVTSESY